MSCSTDLIPLSKAVAAAIVDSYEDSGKVTAQYFHWAAREFKALNRKILRGGTKRKVSLTVNGNTRTATLPTDFRVEKFVGVIQNGEKIPLSLNYKIADTNNIEDVECIDRCPKCNQDKAICEDLQVTEEINLIVINGSTYEQNIVKKLYPNGDYYLETTDPIYNLTTEEVEYVTSKVFINNLDLKPCGCLETTEENLAVLQSCCPDVYGCYYATCSTTCSSDLGGYRIFEESGLIQFDSYFKYNTVYLEYEGFLPKVNGQLQIPEVAFEAVVEGTKLRSIKNRKNEPLWRIREYKDDARRAKNDMIRELGRVSLSYILEAATKLPKFDIKRERWGSCFSTATTSTISTSTSNTEAATSGTTVVEVIRDRISFAKIKFIVGQSGSPVVAGETSLTISVSNIMSNSLNVILDGSNITEIDYDDTFGTDQMEYKVLYAAGQTIVYFNQGLVEGQNYKITYAKQV